MQIRQMKKDEHAFFMDMLYESVYILSDKPSKEALLSSDGMKKYHENWGRSGDEVLVAEEDGELLGAVWYRQFTKDNPGYGFVSADFPEIGMGVKASARGKGIGRKLLEEIIAHAMTQGYEALSLSVDPFNHAAYKLYKSVGFYKTGTSGTSVTMVVSLTVADQRIRGLNQTAALNHNMSDGQKQSRKSKLLVGVTSLFSGILLLAASWITSAIYASDLTEWDGRYGKFYSAMLETSVLPLVLSLILVLFGIVLIAGEREIWQTEKGEY